MRKLLLLIICVPLYASSQITTKNVAPSTSLTKTVLYDSTKNFLGTEAEGYIGQDLYLNQVSESSQKYGYEGFFNDYKNSTLIDLFQVSNTYKALIPESKSLAMSGLGMGRSLYDDMNGRYFTVLDVVKSLKGPPTRFLKLVEKETGDTVYYKYSSLFEHSFPFIVVGYFEKIKDKAVGRKIVVPHEYMDDLTDINTKRIVVAKLGDVWECFDVIIEDEYFKIAYLLKNSLGTEIAITSYGYDKSYEAAEALKYKTKFGGGNWNSILKGNVVIGMTNEMCALSWGQPKDINKTIVSGKRSEQWVYDENYLYFDNGKLTAIQ